MARNEPCVCQPGEGLGHTMNDQCSGTQAEKISAEIAALANLEVKDLKSTVARLVRHRAASQDQPRVAHAGDRIPLAGERVRRSGASDAPATRTGRRRPVTSARETKSCSQSSSRYLTHSRVAG